MKEGLVLRQDILVDVARNAVNYFSRGLRCLTVQVYFRFFSFVFENLWLSSIVFINVLFSWCLWTHFVQHDDVCWFASIFHWNIFLSWCLDHVLFNAMKQINRCKKGTMVIMLNKKWSRHQDKFAFQWRIEANQWMLKRNVDRHIK